MGKTVKSRVHEITANNRLTKLWATSLSIEWLRQIVYIQLLDVANSLNCIWVYIKEPLWQVFVVNSDVFVVLRWYVNTADWIICRGYYKIYRLRLIID